MGGKTVTTMTHGMSRMRRPWTPRRRWIVAAVTAACAAIAVPAVVVYACVGLVALEATPASVQPGGTVSLRGMDFVPTTPVQIHTDSIDGPVIATVMPAQMTGGVMSSRFSQTITIPSTLSTGQHLLIATQTEHNMNGGNPARTVIYVGAAAPGSTAPEARPASAQLDTGPGLGVLIMIGLAATLVGLLVFGFFLLRGPRTPSAQTGAA